MRKILEPETLDLGGGFEIFHGVAGEDVSLIGTEVELQDRAVSRENSTCLRSTQNVFEVRADSKK